MQTETLAEYFASLFQTPLKIPVDKKQVYIFALFPSAQTDTAAEY